MTPTVVPAPSSAGVDAAVLLLAEPFRSEAHHRISRGLARLDKAWPRPAWDIDAVGADLAYQVDCIAIDVVRGVFALELNLARLADSLDGDSPESRFADFLDQLKQPATRRYLLAQYPALTFAVREACSQQAEAMLELVTRLSDDWPELRRTFPEADTAGQLVAVHAGAGDPHRGGRSVTLLRFAHGWQLVYKPRPLAPESHYDELLRWTNAHGWSPEFRSTTTLLRSGHGWMEHVSPSPCRSSSEVARFYRRIGGQLAVLHVLVAGDVHQENLVAVGQHPVLVDLEALFQSPAHGTRPGPDPLRCSVLQVGMLPTRAGARPAGGAIGADHRDRAVATDWGWQSAGTDHMHLVRVQPSGSLDSHRPMLAGRLVDFRAHRDDVVGGFEDMYRLLAEHRDELLADGGPIEAFRDDAIRVIIRPTSVYGRLIEASRHPDALCSVEGPGRVIARVERLLSDSPHLADLVASEQRDLARGDIPLFTARASSCDVWVDYTQCSPGVLDRSGLAMARSRIAALREVDLARQRWAIDASFAISGFQAAKPQAGPVDSCSLTGACRIADRLLSLAYLDGDSLDWLGVRAESRGLAIDRLGPRLYDGTLGVGLFLTYLGTVSGRPRLLDIGLRSVHGTAGRLYDDDSALTGVGAFAGWGGAVYALAHAAAVAAIGRDYGQAENCRRSLVQAIARLDHALESDNTFDVIGGAAGAILALTACSGPDLHRDEALAVAVRAGDHLLARATRTSHGLGWIAEDQTLPLSGFAHGGAGIALALWRLGDAAGESRFQDAAISAVAHERSLFCPSKRTWLDLRRDRIDPTESASHWCHGAAGIGLGRVHMLGTGADAETYTEVRTAVNTVVAHLGEGRLSPCHGALGDLELLLAATQHLPDAVTRSELDALCAGPLARAERHTWNSSNSGIDPELDSPALMNGLSGIGYQLLRFHDPARVPSLLTLAPPSLCRPSMASR